MKADNNFVGSKVIFHWGPEWRWAARTYRRWYPMIFKEARHADWHSTVWDGLAYNRQYCMFQEEEY